MQDGSVREQAGDGSGDQVHSAALGYSWPLQEQAGRFELGHLLNCAVIDAIPPCHIGRLSPHHAGLWECNLDDESLIWSGGVYDLFGLERGDCVTRAQALACYTEESRAKLERLRLHALEHRQGFTVDIEIRAAAVRELRAVRVIATPLCTHDVATRLVGLKLAL